MSRTILAIGLPPTHPSIAEHFKDIDPETLRQSIATAHKSMKDAGYDVKPLFIGDENGVVLMKEELTAKRYDALVVGFGVRGNPALTPLFERIVNEALEAAPGIKLLFNTSPENTLEAVKRWF